MGVNIITKKITTAWLLNAMVLSVLHYHVKPQIYWIEKILKKIKKSIDIHILACYYTSVNNKKRTQNGGQNYGK